MYSQVRFFSCVGVVSTMYIMYTGFLFIFSSVTKYLVLREELSDRVFRRVDRARPASLVSDALPTQTRPCPENRHDRCPTTSIFCRAQSWAVSI